MTSNRASQIPPELEDRLRDEPAAAELVRMWDLLDEASTSVPSVADNDAAWRRLRAATVDAPHRAADRPPVRRVRRSRWLAPAFAVVLALAGWLYLTTHVTVTAPAGSFATVALPDGSTAELNSGSVLEYDRLFWRLPFVEAEERNVRLVGEAFFDVERGERPFVVQTADARVRVLGTAFNVRARDAETVVTVTEGRVRVEGTDETVVLDPGDRARVVDGVPTRDASGVARALAWREQGFAAQEQPLAAIFAELERRYAVEVTLKASGVADDTLTLYFSQPTDAEAILRDICTARDLNYRRTSRGFEVY